MIAALVGCHRAPAPRPSGSAEPATSAPAADSSAAAAPAPTTFGQRLAAAALEKAGAAFAAWKACDSGPKYAAFRRALAAAEPFARGGSRLAADTIYGPMRPSQEGAGALAMADAALAARDCAVVEKQRYQLRQGLTLAASEVGQTKRLFDDRIAQLGSDAAYELGLALLDARATPSHDDEAQRADVLGLADAIADCVRVFGETPPAELEVATRELARIRARVEGAEAMLALGGRADLVRATGAVGLSIRRAAQAKGMRIRTTYRLPPGVEDTSTSALTLPPPRVPIDPALAALGRRLFDDTRLSGSGKRSCASCHDSKHGYAEARPTPASADASTPLLRNTPTLLYDGLAATQLWDGRIVTAETQALRVVHNKAELGLKDDELVARIAADPAYVKAFAALPEHEVTPSAVGAALGAFVATLGSGTSPVDAYARGDDAALTPELARGFDVFVGVAKCARCHVPPLWGGSRPIDFAVPVYAIIGVPTAAGEATLDDDIGRAGVTKRDKDRGSFKTPTVRDVANTAPYMHNGRFATLEEVVDFYDRGGGRGAGLDVPNQDPDVLPLHLKPDDRQALLAFLRNGLKDTR